MNAAVLVDEAESVLSAPGKRLLTADEEKALARHWQATGDTRVLDRFMLANELLVMKFAGRYRYMEGVDFEDLVQEGLLGIRKAAERYDGSTRFSTYAVHWLRSFFTRHVCEISRPISLHHGAPGSILMREGSVRRKLEARGIEPTDEAIAKEAKVKLSTLRTVRSLRAGALSFDAPIARGGEDGRVLSDVLPSGGDTPEDQIIEADERSRLLFAVSTLPPRLQKIIRIRFEGDKTLAGVGRELGLSRERIRQLEVEALQMLKQRLAEPQKERRMASEPSPKLVSVPKPPAACTPSVRSTSQVASPPADAADLMRLGEVAQHLGISRNSVYKNAQRGALGRVRTPGGYRYSRASVEAYARSRGPAYRRGITKAEAGTPHAPAPFAAREVRGDLRAAILVACDSVDAGLLSADEAFAYLRRRADRP